MIWPKALKDHTNHDLFASSIRLPYLTLKL